MLVGVRLRSVVIMFEKCGFPLKILSMSTTLLLFLEIIDVFCFTNVSDHEISFLGSKSEDECL